MNSFCFILGPHRNLTTLLASIFILHPSIHGLNHGYKIFDSPEYKFIEEYTDNKFNSFLDKATGLLDSDKFIARDGGSMVGSHAFKRSKYLQNIYSKTKKQEIKSIVWKHPENYHLLRDNIDEFVSKNDKFRFLMPIRNPMDCAVSNHMGFKHLFGGDNVTKSEVLEQLFDMYEWFVECNEKYPDKFLYFFENELTEKTLKSLLYFLDLDIDGSEQWIKHAQNAWEITNKKNHSQELINQYKTLASRFSQDVEAKFLLLLESK